MKVLVVVDMQNDFIDGSLGTPEAETIVPRVKEKIEGFSGKVLFTRDTHEEGYLDTQEGRLLPVEHCIRGTQGWQISPALQPLLREEAAIDKPTFGSVLLGERLRELDRAQTIDEVILIGLCTDICVISNALLVKAFLPEAAVTVEKDCCAGVTPASHEQALKAMQVCQIQVV